MGHSIHHKHYRYTEWRDKENQTVSSVLTDLSVDPGEVTNVQNEPKYAEALALVRERLEERIKLAAYSNYSKKAPVGAPGPTGNSINRQSLLVDPSPQKLRQPIDGFGGSIAFWGTNPDDEAMKIAFQELKTTILRVQGEVSRKGITDKNREVLQRAMKLNPELEVMLTFWQPRSAGLLEVSDWLDVVEEESGKKVRPQALHGGEVGGGNRQANQALLGLGHQRQNARGTKRDQLFRNWNPNLHLGSLAAQILFGESPQTPTRPSWSEGRNYGA
jgi:hypothetical protein